MVGWILRVCGVHFVPPLFTSRGLVCPFLFMLVMSKRFNGIPWLGEGGTGVHTVTSHRERTRKAVWKRACLSALCMMLATDQTQHLTACYFDRLANNGR